MPSKGFLISLALVLSLLTLLTMNSTLIGLSVAQVSGQVDSRDVTLTSMSYESGLNDLSGSLHTSRVAEEDSTLMGDTEPPVVDAFVIADDATVTTDTTVSLTVTATDLTSKAGAPPVYLPLIRKAPLPTPTPTPTSTPTSTPTPPLINGDFETGGFSNWTVGGELPQSITSEDKHSGDFAALLGNPDWGPALSDPIPAGHAYIEQVINIPSVGIPELSFWYHLISYDVMTGCDTDRVFDTLDVTINGTLIYRDGDPNCNNQAQLYDSGWKSSPKLNLSAYLGQTVTLRFAVWNREYPPFDGLDIYNTWVYVDDIILTSALPTPTPTATLTPVPCINIEMEDNDISGLANPICEDVWIQGVLEDDADDGDDGDIDYYGPIELEQSATIRLSLDMTEIPLSAGVTYRLNMLLGNSSIQDLDNSGGGITSTKVELEANKPYFFRVYRHGGDEDLGTYRVMWEVTITPTATPTPTPTPSCLTTEQEPNDTIPQASQNPPTCEGAWVEGTLPNNDLNDIYRIEIAQAGTLQVDLINIPQGTDYDLYLYQSGVQGWIARSVNDGNAPEHIEHSVSSGIYYLLVFAPFGGLNDEEYSLKAIRKK